MYAYIIHLILYTILKGITRWSYVFQKNFDTPLKYHDISYSSALSSNLAGHSLSDPRASWNTFILYASP